MKKTIFRLAGIAFLFFAFIPAHAQKEGIFKDWNYSPTEVFGLIRLENTSNKPYYKISRIDNQSTKIQEYNASGIVENTKVIRFVNGKLNTITSSDEWGKVYEITKFTVTGPDEFMVTRRNNGKNSYLPCKGAKYIYKNKLLVEMRNISYNNKLCNNGSSVAITRYKRYDDKNRFSLLKELAFFDADNKPVISSSYDCYKVVYEYSERGNQTSIAYYGTGNEPLTNRYGGFKSKYQYDEDDKMIKSESIGLNDEVTANVFGVAKTEYEYKNGLTIKQTRFDGRNNITRASAEGDGIAIIKYEYDDNGNETKRSFYDENNSPINNNSGYHQVTYRYSSLNMLTDIEYFDKNKTPINDIHGIHRYNYIKDNKGNSTGEAYFDKSDVAVQDDHDEVYMVKYKYDESGREISRSFWKDNTTKMTRWNGYHEQISKYNEDGLVTESLYLDETGNLFTSSSGFSRLVTNYNSNAQLSERKCYNGNTPAAVTKSFVNDYHSIKYFYDNNSRVSLIEYFNTDSKPVNANISFDKDSVICHKIEFVYKGNRIIQEKCYQANNESPIRILDCLSHDYINTSGLNKGYKNQ